MGRGTLSERSAPAQSCSYRLCFFASHAAGGDAVVERGDSGGRLAGPRSRDEREQIRVSGARLWAVLNAAGRAYLWDRRAEARRHVLQWEPTLTSKLPVGFGASVLSVPLSDSEEPGALSAACGKLGALHDAGERLASARIPRVKNQYVARPSRASRVLRGSRARRLHRGLADMVYNAPS